MHRSCIALCLLPLVVLAEEPLRTWTSTSGKSVEAAYQGLRNGEVLLKTGDGRALKVPFASLSPKDRGYLEGLGRKRADPPASRSSTAPEPAPVEVEDIPVDDTSGVSLGKQPSPASLPDLGKGDALPRKTFSVGGNNVKGYLVYRFKNGLTAVVFSGNHNCIDFYHPRLGRTFYMRLGPHDHTQLVVDDVALRPPNVRIRYTGMGYAFSEERMSLKERQSTPRIEVGKGEVQMTFKPDGLDYRSHWKATVENAPVNWIHFHVPEVGHGRTFRGGKEAFREAFAGTGLKVVPKVALKKTLEMEIGDIVQKVFVDARAKYSWAHTPPGYAKVDILKRAGTERVGWFCHDDDSYLHVQTYHNEPMERRMWVGHKHITSKRRFNYIPNLETKGTHIRMKEGVVLTLTGGMVFGAP